MMIEQYANYKQISVYLKNEIYFWNVHGIINIVLSKIDENRCKQTLASLP